MSKIAIITADLHIGITSGTKILSIKKEMLKNGNPDIIILAGDIGEPVNNFEICLKLFSDIRCPVGVVIGNHDLYNTDGNYHSEELWRTILPDIVKKYGFIWMEKETITVNNIAFIGTMAWYDYSSRVPVFSHLPDDFFYKNKGRFVNDGNYIDWDRRDTDFSSELLDSFEKRLAMVQEDKAIRRIIVVTHVPLFKEQLIHYYSDNRYADAYFGNFTMGKRVARFSKVIDVISGHTHRGVDTIVGSIRTKVIPSDYGKPAFITLKF